MLVLARESRGLTQGELADAMTAQDGAGSAEAGQPVSQGYVSRAEAGRLPVAGDRLDAFSRALLYPQDLLCLDEPEVGAGPGLVHHRKKQSVPAAGLRRILAVLNLTRVQLRGLGVDDWIRGDAIPQIAVDDYDTPEDAARTVRSKWGVPAGPAPSLVGLLEDAGALVTCRDLIAPVPLDSGAETVPVDAVSTRPDGEAPLMLLNNGTPAERQRFTLAHELGHLVMHQVPDPEQELQADRFAAELLMPGREILPQLQGSLDVAGLLELKGHWQVSMWALLRRARTLGAVSDWQYRKLAIELSSLGYRTREPAALQPDTPLAVERLVAEQQRRGHSLAELARRAYLHPDEFTRLYASSHSSADPAAPSPIADESAGPRRSS
jgi:Zn-dependent peptidase ImmA (M78 family)/transcriptional regulator with XRE-family HTH domain